MWVEHVYLVCLCGGFGEEIFHVGRLWEDDPTTICIRESAFRAALIELRKVFSGGTKLNEMKATCSQNRFFRCKADR